MNLHVRTASPLITFTACAFHGNTHSGGRPGDVCLSSPSLVFQQPGLIV